MSRAEDIVDTIEQTDVLILGSEGAGGMAAVKAAESGQKITVLTKGDDVGRSGGTVCAAMPYSCCAIDGSSAKRVLELFGNLSDSFEIMADDVFTQGRWVGNPELIEIVCLEVANRALDLRKWGFRWVRDMQKGDGESYPRGSLAEVSLGPHYVAVMRKHIHEISNIKIVPQTIATDILTHGGRIAGLTAIDMISGKCVLYRCKSLVLAAGAAHDVYPYTTSSRGMSGDAMAMAFRAGAAIIDPEFVQFQRVAIWPPKATHSALGLLQSLRGLDIWWNSKGQRFAEYLGIERSRKNYEDQEVEKIATMKEILAGRTGEHGGVFSSIHHIPSNLLDLIGKEVRLKNWTSPSGHDFRPVLAEMKKGLAIETSLGAHYFLGGIKINANCESTIPGIFAAGECAGGILGSKRTAGMALTSCMTLGARAGEFAAAHAKGKEHEPIPMNSLRESHKRIFEPLQRREGTNPLRMKEKIQQLAFLKVGVVRTQTGLQEAIRIIEEIKKTDASNLYVKTKETIYNLEWVEAIETLNILQCLEIIARAALIRNESRGTHYRDDYPYEDNDDWLKNVIVSKNGDEMQLTTSSIQIGKFKGKVPTGQHEYFPLIKSPVPIRSAASR